MAIRQSDAIVLQVMDYGEADIIAKLFTLDVGKLGALARHARKSTRRFAGTFAPFAHLSVELRVKEGLSTIRNADLVTLFPSIRQDLGKISHAAYACELCDRFLADGQGNPRLFRLLACYLAHLDSTPNSLSDRRFFEVNFLKILGYRLPLDCCGRCGIPLPEDRPASIAPDCSAIFCHRCDAGGETLSPATITLLNSAMSTGRFGVITFPSTPLREAGRILDRALNRHLDQPLRSLAFLEEMAITLPSPFDRDDDRGQPPESPTQQNISW